MATDSRFGLKLVGDASKYGTSLYYIPASYGTALFRGDPVVKTGTANTSDVISPNGLHRAGTLPEINLSTTAGACTGVILDFLPDKDIRETVKNNPASTERIAIVCDDPHAIYEIQCDDTVAATDIGSNAELEFTHAGSTTTGLSGAELDISTAATTATLPLKILRLAEDQIDSNALGANSNVLVKINNHTEGTATAGI